MANKRFGVKEINLVGAAGTPTIESPDNLNINAVNVAISTNLSAGGIVTAAGFSTTTGTSSQFLKADGSVDSNTYLTSYTETQTLDNVVGLGSTTSHTITAAGFSTTTGTSSQFLKADGSVDSNTYLTSYTESDPIVAAINGIVKSDGSTISTATSGTDYLAPSSDGSSLSGIITSISAGTNISLTGGPTGIVTINSSATVDGLWSLDGDNVYYDTAGGNIGIGTTDPTSKLDVDGTLNVSGVSTFQDKVIFDSTNSIQVPVGTEAEKDAVGTAVTGLIRYNTTNSQFEGFGPNGQWGSLGGVKDVDGDTYVKPESSPGSDEDALTFFTGGTERAVIDSNGNIGIGTTDPTSKLTVKGRTDIVDGNLRIENYTYTLTGTITTSTSTGIQTHFGDNVACNGDGSSIMIVGLNTSAQGTISIYDKNGNNYDFVGVVTDTTIIVGYDDDDTPADCVMSDDGNIFAFSSGAARASIGAGNTIVVWQRSGNTLSQLGLIEYDTLTGFGATEGVGTSGVEFGGSLDMSADGTRFVVGAELDRLSNVGIGTTIKTGRAHVIDRSGSTFTGIATLTPSNPYQDANGRFGFNSVMSDDGNTIIVSQPFINSLQGTIYKFSRVGNTVSQVGIATDFGDEDFDEGSYPRRGMGLEISGDGSRIFVGTLSYTTYGNWYYVYVLDSDLNVLEKIQTDIWAGAISGTYEDRKRLQSSYDGKTIVFGNDFFEKNVIYQYSDLHGKYKLVGSSIPSESNGCAITRDGKRVFVGDGEIDDAELNYYDINGAEIDVKGKATISEGVKGSIRQVVGYSTDATFTTSLTGSQHSAVTDMGVEINLSSASNKVLVSYNLTGEFSDADFTYESGISFARDSSNYATGIVTVAPGNADAGYHTDPGFRNRGITTPVTSYQASEQSSTPENLSIINFLDSPNTTGIVTYYPTIYVGSEGGGTWYGNRTVSDHNTQIYERFISYITLQEIVG